MKGKYICGTPPSFWVTPPKNLCFFQLIFRRSESCFLNIVGPKIILCKFCCPPNHGTCCPLLLSPLPRLAYYQVSVMRQPWEEVIGFFKGGCMYCPLLIQGHTNLHTLIYTLIGHWSTIQQGHYRSRLDLVRSHYADHDNPCLTRGTYKFGSCNICQFIADGVDFVLPNGKPFISKHFANCETSGVVYLFTCSCRAFYVLKTIHPLHKCISEHLYATEMDCMKSPIGKHVAQHHRYKSSGVQFRVLEHMYTSIRGGDWDQIIFQSEIYLLNICHPPD